jgi:PAS domain-containing protein
MLEEEFTEAVISLDALGRYLDANAAALELLGVSLAELRASAPDRFTMRPATDAEQAALRSQWSKDGAPPLVGTAGLRRADGTTIRVAYAIEPGDPGFRARLWRVDGSPHAPSTLFTIGQVLREWRSAERKLAELVPGSADWARTLSEIEMLRGRYQELFSVLRPKPDARVE